MREHRLYQADWLMRFYGFALGEIVDGGDGRHARPRHRSQARLGAAAPRALPGRRQPRRPRGCCCACRASACERSTASSPSRRMRSLRLDDLGAALRARCARRPALHRHCRLARRAACSTAPTSRAPCSRRPARPPSSWRCSDAPRRARRRRPISTASARAARALCWPADVPPDVVLWRSRGEPATCSRADDDAAAAPVAAGAGAVPRALPRRWPRQVDLPSRSRTASRCSTGCSGACGDEPRPARRRVRSGRRAARAARQGGAPRHPQDARLRALPRDRGREGEALSSPGSSRTTTSSSAPRPSSSAASPPCAGPS